MAWWHQFKAALRFLLRRREAEQQMDDELRSFAAHRADALERGGLDRAEAERQSRVEMRGAEQVKEAIRDAVPGGRLADSSAKDLLYTLRMMRKAPGFTAVVALTLALGIGGTTAIFTVVKAVLLDPLPYADPSRLVILWAELPERGVLRAPGSGFELRELRARSRTLESIGGIWASNGTFLGEGEPEQVKVGQVTGNFFDVLGTPPLLGRTLRKEDEGSGKPPVIVLSHGLWARRFGANPGIIGQTVRMGEGSPVVVGVMPPQFQMNFPPDSQVPREIQAWFAFPWDLNASGPRAVRFIRYVGCLRVDATVAQANEELAAISAQLRAEFIEFERGKNNVRAVPMHGDAVREIRPALLALFGGIALVLLIACVNVANLLLARSSLRRKEIALHAALGASRGRVFRQALLESLTLAALGGVAGIAVAWFALQRLVALAPPGVLRAGGDPLSLAPAVRSKIRELDKDLAISKLRPMTFYLDRALATTRFTMVLAALFGGLALLLAALGIYGVVAYSANQRMREFGIRMALGAHARDIRRQVLREGLALALGGLLLGAAGALALGRFLQTLLFGVTATDLATYLACAVVLPAVALLACWLPARRAARRDPLAILRTE